MTRSFVLWYRTSSPVMVGKAALVSFSVDSLSTIHSET